MGDEFEQPFANSKQKGNREAKALYEERMTEGLNTGRILEEGDAWCGIRNCRAKPQREM